MVDLDASRRAGLGRRFIGLAYELLLVVAVLLVASAVFKVLFGDPHSKWAVTGFRSFMVAALGLYFVPQWAKGGQSLPMKTWRLRLETISGTPLNWQRALARYIFGWLSCIFAGLGFVWAFFDRDRQFFHDRMAGTRIVRVQPAVRETAESSSPSA